MKTVQDVSIVQKKIISEEGGVYVWDSVLNSLSVWVILDREERAFFVIVLETNTFGTGDECSLH